MANLNDLLIPWSEKLPQEIQNLDFEISESFSSIGVDVDHLAHQSSVEIITTINEQIFNNLGRNTEALFGTNFISFVTLQVVFDELLTSNFMDLFNSSSYVDLIQECIVSCKFKGVRYNFSELISQTYYEYNQFNDGLTENFVDTYDWDLNQLNSYLRGISAGFKDQFFVNYLNLLNNVIFQFISKESQEDFVQLSQSINDILVEQAHLESEIEAQRHKECDEIIAAYDLKGDSPIIIQSEYDANVYSRKAYVKTGRLIRIQELYKLKSDSHTPKRPSKKANAKKAKRKEQKKSRKKNR